MYANGFTKINVFFFVLKFIEYNGFGTLLYVTVLIARIGESGQSDCSGSVLAYMGVISGIEILVMSVLIFAVVKS